jgi:hypothetical protein
MKMMSKLLRFSLFLILTNGGVSSFCCLPFFVLALLWFRGYSGKDYNSASNLLSCLVISCKSLVQNGDIQLHTYLPNILLLVFEKLSVVRIKSVKIRLLEIVMSSFYYDASLTLSIILSIQSPVILEKVTQLTGKSAAELQMNPSQITLILYFNMLFDLLKDMDRDFTQRLIVLSFLAIMSLPTTSFPEIIQINLPSMFQQVVRELIMIEEQAKIDKEKEENGEETDDEEEGDEDDEDEDDEDDYGMKGGKGHSSPNKKMKDYSLRHTDDDDDDDEEGEGEGFDENDPIQAEKNRLKALYVPEGGYHEDEDCLNAEDEEYRQVLENLSKEDRIKKELFMAGEPVDDEEDEDFIYTSPIENLPMAALFVHTMTDLSNKDASYVEFLKKLFNEEDHQRTHELIKIAFEQQQQQAQIQQGSSTPK